MNKYKRVFLYLFSSTSSFIIDIIVFSILSIWFDIILSSYIARLISSIYNYLINKVIVFENKTKKNIKSFILYFLLVLINITISGFSVDFIYKNIHLNATITKVLIDTIIFIANYYLQKYIIFKK